MRISSPGLRLAIAFFFLAPILMTLPFLTEVAAQDRGRTAAVEIPGVPNSEATNGLPPMTEEQVGAFAELAMKNIHREYPNKTGDVVTGPEGVLPPSELHPAFYGCFDWHSSVHGHWMLVRLLKQFPDHSVAPEIRRRLAISLTEENLRAELAYFEAEGHRTFERTYGWAWFLKLVSELDDWDDEQGRQFRQWCRPLEELLVQRTLDYLPKLSFPIRTGVHPDTGFALGQFLDYARATGNADLEQAVADRAMEFYRDDQNYPASWEPSGQDFFSSGLNEADLMRRLLDAEAFAKWLTRFLPQLGVQETGDSKPLFAPVAVSDVTDGYIVHLAGLNLSRAWCLRGIADALPESDARKPRLIALSRSHASKGLEYVFSGAYEGEHWLATFAVYLLS